MGGGLKRGRCSVQVVQVFLFYFSPESVRALLLNVCGAPFAPVRLKYLRKRSTSPSAAAVLAEKKSIPVQPRRDHILEGEVVGPCSAAFACSVPGSTAGPWEGCVEKHCLLRFERQLVGYGQCWEKT